MLNAQQLIDLVNDMTLEPTDGTGKWSDAQILVKLNNAQDEIDLKISDLLRTVNTSLTPVSGTQTYTIPATVGKLYQVWINGKPIESKGSDSLGRDFAYSAEITLSGLPTTYYVQNNVLYLYPIPDSSVTSITLIGEIILTEMTDSASSYPFETVPYLRKAQKILAMFAAADCCLIDGDTNQYTTFRTEAQNLLDELESDWEMYKTAETHSVVKQQLSEDALNQDKDFSTTTY